MKPDRIISSNHCVQATPDYALLFFLSQGSGVPEPKRSVTET